MGALSCLPKPEGHLRTATNPQCESTLLPPKHLRMGPTVVPSEHIADSPFMGQAGKEALPGAGPSSSRSAKRLLPRGGPCGPCEHEQGSQHRAHSQPCARMTCGRESEIPPPRTLPQDPSNNVFLIFNKTLACVGITESGQRWNQIITPTSDTIFSTE